jgi:dCTP deaminase
VEQLRKSKDRAYADGVILSNVEIHKALDAGDIIITPEPMPRLPSLANAKSPYDTTAVNLRLSPVLSLCVEDPPMAFDLRKPNIKEWLGKVYEPRTMDDGGYSLKPNQFVLGNTVEYIELPIRAKRPVYAARVEGRSSFARCGMVIHFTAPTIHAGFEGTITFEIMNFGKSNINLFPNLEIGQLIFERVLGTPKRNDSQFQGQRTPPGKKK